MNNFDQLSNAVLSEAPIGSHLRSMGRGVKNVARSVASPAAWLKGAANVARGTGNFINKYGQLSSNNFPAALNAGANALDKTASGLKAAKDWIKDPDGSGGYGNVAEKPPKRGDSANIQTKVGTTSGRVVKIVKKGDQTILVVRFVKELPIIKKTTNSPSDGVNVFIGKSSAIRVVFTKKGTPISAQLSAAISPTENANNWSIYV
jgi:hypothetical protein